MGVQVCPWPIARTRRPAAAAAATAAATSPGVCGSSGRPSGAGATVPPQFCAVSSATPLNLDCYRAAARRPCKEAARLPRQLVAQQAPGAVLGHGELRAEDEVGCERRQQRHQVLPARLRRRARSDARELDAGRGRGC